MVKGEEDTIEERKVTSVTSSVQSTFSQMAAEQRFNAQRFRGSRAAGVQRCREAVRHV